MTMKTEKHSTKKQPTALRKYSKLSSLWWAVQKMWRLDRPFIFYVLIFIPLAVVPPLVRSYFSKLLIDQLGAGVVFAELVKLCLGFCLLLFLLENLESYYSAKVYGRTYYGTLNFQGELSLLTHYETDYENTEREEFRELWGYAGQDGGHGNHSLEFVWTDLRNFLTHTLGIITYGSLLAWIDPWLLLVVSVVSGSAYFTSRWQPVYYENHKQMWEKENRKKEYLGSLSDNFTAAKDIKLYGLEVWLTQMMRDYQAHIRMWEARCSLRGVWAAMAAGLMTLIQDGAAYLFLIGQMLHGTIGVGDFVFYFGVVSSIATFFNGLLTDVAALNSRADKIAYYRSMYDYPNHFNHGDGCPLPSSDEGITIECQDVWYRYAGAEDDTLKGLNLTIQAGESIALVGLNGAGKTTLVSLLCGLYQPTRGKILVNGRSIQEYNIEEYYSLVSAVFQVVTPTGFTILNFITSTDLKRPTAIEDAIVALQKANLWDKIQSLPNGIDTHLMKGIYEDGVDLSGGEMQKLLLARAIYKDGPILILDEPTAALDPIAENQLYLQYRELTRGKTAVYISHRFASTRFCDRIFLLEDGIIKESGTHEELMTLGGQYAYMFGVQSQYYQEGTLDGQDETIMKENGREDTKDE